MVNTNPAGAACSLNRQGSSIARIEPTPGAATIKKTKYDITIVCNKEGFQEATYLNHSGAAGATFGNIVLGGGIGWAIDSASGADNKYDTPVNLTLVRVELVEFLIVTYLKRYVVSDRGQRGILVGYMRICKSSASLSDRIRTRGMLGEGEPTGGDIR
jgi:hypothetical protein